MFTETKSGILLFPKDMNWDDIGKKEAESLVRSIAVCSELDKLADDINKLSYPQRRKAANYCYKLDIGSDTDEITIEKIKMVRNKM